MKKKNILKETFEHSKLHEDTFEEEKKKLISFAKKYLPGLTYQSGRTSYSVRRYDFSVEELTAFVRYVKKTTTDMLDPWMRVAEDQTCLIRRNDNGGISITVPRRDKEILRLGDGIEELEAMPKTDGELIAYVGEKENGDPAIIDFNAVPHWMVAGNTGSGKSVCLMNIIMTMLDRYTPEELNMYIADDKAGLTQFENIPHIIMQESGSRNICGMFKALNTLMEERAALLNGKDILHYNHTHPKNKLPQIVILFDEADSIIGKDTGERASEIREYVRHIAAEGRSCGLHLIIASQKPVGENINTRIKSLIQGRIALLVASSIDSRAILDKKGAEKLLGDGDAFIRTSVGGETRIQCAYATETEIEKAKKKLADAYRK